LCLIYLYFTRVLSTSGLGTGKDAKSSEEVEAVWKELCNAHPPCWGFEFFPIGLTGPRER